MSATEIDRVGVVRRVLEHGLKRVKAAEILRMSTRQVRRLCAAYEVDGAHGLVSKRRGKPSNHRLAAEVKERAVDVVRTLYPDFAMKRDAHRFDRLLGMVALGFRIGFSGGLGLALGRE